MYSLFFLVPDGPDKVKPVHIDEGDPQYDQTLDDIIKRFQENEFHQSDYKKIQIRAENYKGARLALDELDDHLNTKNPIKIPVTTNYISEGTPGDSNECPLAIAIDQTEGDAEHTGVEDTIQYMDWEGYDHELISGQSVEWFINKFDKTFTAPAGTLYFGKKYAWFIPEGDKTPYECIERDIQTNKTT